VVRGGWPGWNGWNARWNGWQRAARAPIRHAVVPGPFGGSGEGLGAAVPLVGARGRAPGHVAVPSFGVSEADVGPGPERGDSTRTAARAGPPEGYGGNLAPPHPAWGHVGARLGHPPQLRSGCQRSVAEFGRYVVCAGGSRPIHPNRGTGLPPKGLGGDPTPKIRPNRRHRARAGRGSNARSRPCRTTTLSATFPFQRGSLRRFWPPSKQLRRRTTTHGLWFGAPRAPRYSALRDAAGDKPGGRAIRVVI
jgi:hypothetical protein